MLCGTSKLPSACKPHLQDKLCPYTNLVYTNYGMLKLNFKIPIFVLISGFSENQW